MYVMMVNGSCYLFFRLKNYKPLLASLTKFPQIESKQALKNNGKAL